MIYPNSFLTGTCLLFSTSKMDGEEIFDAFNASGSASVKFNVEVLKQENLHGWDADA